MITSSRSSGSTIPIPDFTREFSDISAFLLWWLSHTPLDPIHDAVLKTYYASYCPRFGRHMRCHYADQSREIDGLITACHKPRLLEVGAGCGTESLWFALRGADVLAIDVKEERLKVARARQVVVEEGIGRSLDLEFRLGSLFDLQDTGSFDLMWMEQAFHHIEPRERLYEKVARLLKPGGQIVISEANAWNPMLQVALLRQRGFSTVGEFTAADGTRVPYGNERITVPGAIAKGFARVGVIRQAVRYFRVLPNIAVADVLMPLERAVPAFAVPLFTHYNYVGRKMERR